MNISEILYSIIIRPIQLFFEVVYSISYRTTGSPGLSIIALSVIMNILVLPLYMRADKIQEEQRKKEESLRKGINHIKSVFKGDERMMMIQTYYRQMDYKQTDALKSSVSLLLQIPFFIAAYQFLSNLDLLNGVSLGPINNLGQPDMMLSAGVITINVLPFIMTGINLVSCVIFTKGYPLKTKFQLYAMACFFLVFLYNSPSGLVFYWTLNNIFSLIKTLFYKIRNPFKVLTVISTVLAVVFISAGLFLYNTDNLRRRVLVIFLGLLFLIPMASSLLRKNEFRLPISFSFDKKKHGILAECLFLTALLGCTIPSSVICSSPMEFADIQTGLHPLIYVVSSAAIAFGYFVIWANIFYHITSNSAKYIYEKIIWILCVAGTINYMLFGSNPGILTPELKYLLPRGLQYSTIEIIINLSVLFVMIILFFAIKERFPAFAKYAVYTGTIVLLIMASLNIYRIHVSYEKASENLDTQYEGMPSFPLSKTGKNVIVFMLDRAMNEFVPYLFNERPQLKAQFAGFTYYPNTISFGPGTYFGAPPLFGGYEYTPVEMNKRNTEKLADKHNEALKVMPVLFEDNGFEVTICDPPYAGYQWISDLSIYDDHPDFNTYITEGLFMEPEIKNLLVEDNKRNFFCYSIMKVSPLIFRKTIYNDGVYNNNSPAPVSSQIVTGTSVAHGMFESFLRCYSVMSHLNEMTSIQEEKENTLLVFQNTLPHCSMLLQEPDYTPEVDVDNTKYDEEHKERFSIDGQSLIMENEEQFAHYETNMATMIELGKWFDYMRENGVYDNTRIILVADHGYGMHSLPDMEFSDSENDLDCDLEFFYPLLMVKDFGATDFTISEEFMTNGDVPSLAAQGIINDPVNPFTGKALDNSEKYLHDQYVVCRSEFIDVEKNNDNTFVPSDWLKVHDDMRKKENWKVTGRATVISSYDQ